MLYLPSEAEILSRFKGKSTKPLVTFLCITYNQENYIEQTIKGFLKQKTSFPYEILIHDDQSTDSTKSIIESYRLRYPNIMRCIYQDENQYSKGISPIVIAGIECISVYVALCEGDDYWINEKKIENQLKLIMSDKSISMVVSPGKLEQDGKILSELHCYYGAKNQNVNAQDILDITGQFAPTASYLLKKSFLINAINMFKKAPVDDTFIELYSAVFGKLVYYPEVSSVYRVSAKNSWSERMASNAVDNQIKFIESMTKIIDTSKNIKGFECLDWSKKLASMYYVLAIFYFKEKKFSECSKAIENSYRHSFINNKQKAMFYSRKNISYLYYLFRVINFLKFFIYNRHLTKVKD